MRVVKLLQESLSLPDSEQRRWLISKTISDLQLRDEVLHIFDNIRKPRRVIAPPNLERIVQLLDLPQRIGEYEVLKELGRGGMGTVYLGRKRTDQFDHYVAIKVVRDQTMSQKLTLRLRSERRSLAKLKHPHISQFYDGGELDDGRPYLVMEYIEGGLPINEYFAEVNPTFEQRLRLFLQVCSALTYAHQKAIVHRDVTPTNILVGSDGRAKLIDFGIAQDESMDRANAITTSGDLRPQETVRLTMTRRYAAPERLVGESSTVGDVFAMGVIVRELC